jgi:tetratricopeptide (TPR) repeat protein
MDKNQLIKDVKRLVGEADVEKALALLDSFFENNVRYKNFSAYAVQIRSFYKKTKNEEDLAIITQDQAKANYNKINYQLLDLLEHVERDDFDWRPKAGSGSKTMAFSIGAVLLLLVGGFFLYRWLQPDTPTPPPDLEVCPTYKPDTEFNILVFPYLTYDNNQLRPHQAVFDRLSDLAKTYNINLGVDFFYGEEDTADFPRNDEQFSSVAQSCNANLAIWGRSEALSDQTILRTQYKFLNVEESFEFNKIMIEEETEIDTVRSISSIANSGTVTENIEQIILFLFGIVAHETTNDDAAIAVLEQVQIPDSAATLLKGMALADSYIRENQPDKAAATYDKVLEVHPNYWFALNNRGMLNYKAGDYEQSIEDLSGTINLRPKDTMALSVRGAAYTKTEQLNKAKKDLDKAKELDPNNKSIDAKLEDWNKKERELKIRNIELERKVESNPNDVQALNNTARTNLNLGDYSKSLQYSEKAITNNPQNLEAYATKIKSLIELGQEEKARESLEKAVESGINRESLLKAVPELRTNIISIKRMN